MPDTDLVDPPKGAIGLAISGGNTWPGLPAGTHVLMESDAEVMALTWPTSIITFDKIRRDAQAAACFASLTTPIRQYPWAVDPNGAEDEVVEKFADDVSLPIIGQEERPIGRTRNRFNHDDHLAHALLALLYGHQFMEQQGYVDDDLNWRLRKLFPIMPRTIGQIEIQTDGGLVGIRQNLSTRPGSINPPLIPVRQLVAYVWGKEGPNWRGRSLMVPVYRHWLIKDRLLRVDAVKHERTGAGVPIVEAGPGASATEIARLDAMAQAFKVGEAAGGAVPAGTKFRLVGVEGATSDVLASIRYQDEAIAQSFFQEVKTLGQSAYGSRALGETFAGNAIPIQNAIASWYARTTNEHVIEDWVDWNFGGDYGAPRLVWQDPNAEVPTDEDGANVEVAKNILAATHTLAALASKEVAPGIAVLNLPEKERRDIESARDWAIGILAKAGKKA